MYFWKIENLKEDIGTGNFTEKDRFFYAFVYIAFGVIGMEAMMRMPIDNPNIWDTVNSIANIAIPVVGTFCAYKANGVSNGIDFLGRFFSINFVVAIRFLTLLLPMLIVLFACDIYAFEGEEKIVSTPMDVIPFQLWAAFLYVRTCKHIADVKKS